MKQSRNLLCLGQLVVIVGLAGCSGVDGVGSEGEMPAQEAAAQPAASDLPERIDVAEVPGRLIVNGTFLRPDVALKFRDGAIINVAFGPGSSAAFGEDVPLGATSRASALKGMSAEAALAYLAPNLDFSETIQQAKLRQYPERPSQSREPVLASDVRSWLESTGQLEAYNRAQLDKGETSTPIERLQAGSVDAKSTSACSKWSWFANSFWGSDPIDAAHNCITASVDFYEGWDNCKVASMNDHGPGNVAYTHYARKIGPGVFWDPTYLGNLGPYWATSHWFTDIDDWYVITAKCVGVTAPNDGTLGHAIAHRWD